ncbi:hypothetical protein HYR99_10705 [Candidatus Poribacteria bacterium]|nr:hypothetical protein [Candidatus Poribacteria bacterium]
MSSNYWKWLRAFLYLLTLILTPFLMKKHGFLEKRGSVLGNVTKITLRFLVIIVEAMFFTAVSFKILSINPEAHIPKGFDSEIFNEEQLLHQTMNKMTVNRAKIGTVNNEIHLLLSVAWHKEEKNGWFRRDFEGEIYFIANINDTFEGIAKVHDYSFRPSSGVLGWITGWLEIDGMILHESISKRLPSRVTEILKNKKVGEKLNKLSK